MSTLLSSKDLVFVCGISNYWTETIEEDRHKIIEHNRLIISTSSLGQCPLHQVEVVISSSLIGIVISTWCLIIASVISCPQSITSLSDAPGKCLSVRLAVCQYNQIVTPFRQSRDILSMSYLILLKPCSCYPSGLEHILHSLSLSLPDKYPHLSDSWS